MAEHIGADEARRLADAATPGPWKPFAEHYGVWGNVHPVIGAMDGERLRGGPDAPWVAELLPPPEGWSDSFDEPLPTQWTADQQAQAIADADLIAAAPRLAAEVVRLNELLRVQAEQFDTLRTGIETIVYGDSIRISAEVYRMLDALLPPAAGGSVPEDVCPDCGDPDAPMVAVGFDASTGSIVAECSCRVPEEGATDE